MQSINRNELAQRLLQLIHTNFPLAESMALTADQNMLESGAVDSLGLLIVIEIVEREFSIKVDDSDVVMENFGSVNNLTDYLIRKTASGN